MQKKIAIIIKNQLCGTKVEEYEEINDSTYGGMMMT